MTATHRFDQDELAHLDQQGFVVRRGAFSAREVNKIAEACEDLVDELVRDRTSRRFTFGSYVFDPDFAQAVTVKWEGDSDVVHGLEPFVHLRPALDDWAHDLRFLEPMIDLVGHHEPMLFTEKLNLKRAGYGGPNPLHQDFPYWEPETPRAADIATAVLFLDDATIENGCIHVVPGSHRSGKWAGRTDGDQFLANEIDANGLGDLELVPVEVEAGSVIFFGAFLVHCSAPNTSDGDRRAILFSYQPPIEPCPTQLDLMRQLAAQFAS